MNPTVTPYHILIFIASLRGGGAERVAADLSSRWVQIGHRVTLITESTPESDVYTLHPEVQRISLQTLGRKGILGHSKRLFLLRRQLKRLRPDIVIGFMTNASILSVLAAHKLPCHVIATEHAYPPSQKLSKFWQWLRRRTYPKAAAVVTLAQGSADYLKQHIAAHYVVIPNAIHWPISDAEPVLKTQKQVGKKWLLAVGRLHHEKGFDRLIDAFAKVAPQYPDWRLIILGEGPQRKNLQAQIDQLGLSSQIDLLGRVGNMTWWYRHADMYVLSSRAEGLSNTLQEAMAAGLPVLAVDCPVGPQEIIRDGIDGKLVSNDNATDSLAKGLEQMLSQPELRYQLSQRAPDVKDRFSMRLVGSKWQALFDSLMN
ncbi:glycosyltransferase family 4 protein [Brackiella oedipodis]|uniref:glycosyltransferase family 4 protein n=1 Tax=Brackiella oedipodis TaxID=124225 RepID=UPI00048B9DC7|nr:glycosyltransferase family 4 protein [Brackiella oedipodis]